MWESAFLSPLLPKTTLRDFWCQCSFHGSQGHIVQAARGVSRHSAETGLVSARPFTPCLQSSLGIPVRRYCSRHPREMFVVRSRGVKLAGWRLLGAGGLTGALESVIKGCEAVWSLCLKLELCSDTSHQKQARVHSCTGDWTQTEPAC